MRFDMMIYIGHQLFILDRGKGIMKISKYLETLVNASDSAIGAIREVRTENLRSET